MSSRLLLFFFLALAACQSRPQTSTEASADSIKTDTLAYQTRTYEHRSRFCVRPDSLCAVASFAYPEFQGDAFKALNDSLLADIMTIAEPEGEPGLRPTSLEGVATDFTAGFDTFMKEQRDSLDYPQTWAMEVKSEVIRQTPRRVAVAHTWYESSGGAHPNHATRYATYDRATGRRLTFADLFRPDYQKVLNGIAERIFRQQEKLKPGESLKDRYFFPNDTFALNDNFTLTPTSLTFLFNPYEIKSYAEGETTLEIPLSELEGILRKEAVE